MLTNIQNITINKPNNFYSYVLGTEITEEGVIFNAIFSPEKSLDLTLYNSASLDEIIKVDMLPYKMVGSQYSVLVKGIEPSEILYKYTLDGKDVDDNYMKNHQSLRDFGEEQNNSNLEKCSLLYKQYDWEGDCFPSLQYSDIISYLIHVRGFTKHSSSKVKGKGTYLGIIEKIPYLKELGINQIELMPTYEFYEYNSDKEKLAKGHPKYASDISVDENGNIVENEEKLTLNYWGYKKGSYFCPKANYSYSDDFVTEFKDMVKALHNAGIEIIMQFFFDQSVNRNIIQKVLRFWHMEYHIDGFHLMGDNLPKSLISTDDILSDAKIYFEYVSYDELTVNRQYINKNIADISRGFMTDARRFLKSDDGSLQSFVAAQRHNPSYIHRINYMTCYEGFTLNDLVSYDYKHNEDNGEDNRDGTDYNYSWNCGVEGPSRKKAVVSLRMQQMKNAMCMLLLSQATPMLFMGDELMNTQKGNNNPYCQDNEISWINWNINKSNEELFEFTKALVKFRKAHKGIHLEDELKLMDYKACGFPDLSYHQDMAWKSRMDTFMKHIGVLLYGEYFDDDSIYILYNMHWENHLFGLPKLPHNEGWECVLSTSGQFSIDEANEELCEKPETLCVTGRSIMILKSMGMKGNKKC